MSFLFSIFITAFLCSIPFGLVIASLFFDTDPRLHHSKNIGMSNTWRCCGPIAGLCTLVFDSGKAYLSLWLATQIHSPYIIILGFLCVFFHCFSIYLEGKGGKGVAAAAGVLLFFAPKIWCTAICTWLVLQFLSNKASVASLGATLAALFHCVLYEKWFAALLFSIAFLILIRHRENIIRLRKKQELIL